jgi:hypothetical protein
MRPTTAPIALAALTALLCLPTSWAQDDFDLDALMAEMDIDGSGGGDQMNYTGDLSRQALNYVAGKPVSVSHSGGDIEVLCSDRKGISARAMYEITGTREGPMEAAGKAVALNAWGSSSSGGVKTRTPGRASGVDEISVKLTVNLPREARITVNGGGGTVQVLGCRGTVKVSSRGGGVTATGTYSNINLAAAKGDVIAHFGADSDLVGNNVITAPAGWIDLQLPMSYAGRIYAKAEDVTIAHIVTGTTDANLVSGTINEGRAHLKLTAKSKVEVRDADSGPAN